MVEAGVALVDVIVLVPGLGDVLAPVPGPETAPVPNLANVPIPRIGTDLVPIPKSGTETSLAVVAGQGLLSVLVPGLDPALALVLVAGHVREKETIRTTWTSQKKMVTMRGGLTRGHLLPERAPRGTKMLTLAALHQPRMMVLMNDETLMDPNSYTVKFNCMVFDILIKAHFWLHTHSSIYCYNIIYLYQCL